MKKLIILLLLLSVLAAFTSCKIIDSITGKDEPEDIENPNDVTDNYPEGAIALTMDNFTDYFEIKTTATCDYNYYTESTEAVAYVAFIPKEEYKDAVGKVTFDVNTRVYKWYGYENFKISNKEEGILLNNDIPRGSYKMTIQGASAYPSTDPFRIETDTIGITVKSVQGYVLISESKIEPNEIESLTAAEKQNSSSIYSELSALLENFKTRYDEAENYNYLRNDNYKFTSIYGEELSKLHSSNGYSYKIDKVNNRVETPQGKYYSMDGVWYGQSVLPGTSFVRVAATGMDMDMALEESTPIWDMLDEGATYLKNDEGKYTAYVTLKDMEDGEWREQIKSRFKDYGITTKHDKFVVKYEYDLTDGFSFYISIHYTDVHYHVDYYDVLYNACQKITDIDNSEVKLYTPETHRFILADEFEDAELFKNGLVEINGSTTQISYTTYSDSYRGESHPPYENYVPIRILEGGVYNFTPDKQTITVLDENGKVYGYYDNNNYFSPGLYYIRSNYVVYGFTDVTVTVDSRIYDDYGDIYSPENSIEAGESFSFEFEGNGDLVTLTFTPVHTGLYAFGYHDNISIRYYDRTDLSVYVEETWQPLHNVVLTGGVEYVLALECINYADRTEHFTFTGAAEYIGEVTPDGTVIDSEWQDILAFSTPSFTVNVSAVGYYYVEYLTMGGEKIDGGYFYTEDGKWHSQHRTVTIDGKEVEVFALEAGKNYTFNPALNMREYFLGSIRLVCYEEGVNESSEITVKDSEYITITTSELNTTYSSSVFTFTVTENCRLLITVDSDFFEFYDESGRRYGITVYPTYWDSEFGVETNLISNLKPGTYTIVFKVSEDSADFGSRMAEIRLECV